MCRLFATLQKPLQHVKVIGRRVSLPRLAPVVVSAVDVDVVQFGGGPAPVNEALQGCPLCQQTSRRKKEVQMAVAIAVVHVKGRGGGGG